MNIIENYKSNNALAAVTGDLGRAKNLIGADEQSKLELDDATKRAQKSLAVVQNHFTEFGNKVNLWPAFALNDLSKYVDDRYTLSSAYITYTYLEKLVARMLELHNSVLNLLPKREARKKFKEYDEELKSLMANDFFTLLYLLSWIRQQDPQNTSGQLAVDTGLAVEESKKSFKDRKYKFVNKYPINYEKIVHRFPVGTESEWFTYIENTAPSIAEAD